MLVCDVFDNMHTWGMKLWTEFILVMIWQAYKSWTWIITADTPAFPFYNVLEALSWLKQSNPVAYRSWIWCEQEIWCKIILWHQKSEKNGISGILSRSAESFLCVVWWNAARVIKWRTLHVLVVTGEVQGMGSFRSQGCACSVTTWWRMAWRTWLCPGMSVVNSKFKIILLYVCRG